MQLSLFSNDLKWSAGDTTVVRMDDPNKPDETHRLATIVSFTGDCAVVDFTNADGVPRSRGVVFIDQLT